MIGLQIEQDATAVPLRGRATALLHLLVAMVRAEPRRTMTAIAVVTAGNVSGLGVAFAVKVAVDAATHHDRSRAVTAAVVLTASLALSLGATYPIATVGMDLRERATQAIRRRIMELVTSVSGIEHHERPAYLNRVEGLMRADLDLGEAIASVVDNIATLTLLAISTVMLAGIHPALAVLPATAVPAFLCGMVTQRRGLAFSERTGPLWAFKKGLTQGVAWERTYGPELRLAGAASAIQRLQRDAADRLVHLKARLETTNSAIQLAGDAIFAAGHVAALAFVAHRALQGSMDAGDIVLAVVLAGRVRAHVLDALANAQHLHTMLIIIARVHWLEDHARSEDAGGSTPPPTALATGIRLEAVSFVYPGTSETVLDAVDLDLPAGTIVAVVGENGAGKSTLTKLLCGFYRPTSGRILVDGVDLASIELAAWRERTTAAFQDFTRPQFTVSEAVGLGDVAADSDAIRAAIDRAGAAGFIDQLPEGDATRLGRRFSDSGTQPSGGEWQKLAIARALMPTNPLLFILDEPTAALDPQAEHDLFETARRQARDNTARGVTVFVSHRFSSVRLADLIVVIEDGRIVEIGAHDELVAKHGRYSELFERQARAYR